MYTTANGNQLNLVTTTTCEPSKPKQYPSQTSEYRRNQYQENKPSQAQKKKTNDKAREKYKEVGQRVLTDEQKQHKAEYAARRYQDKKPKIKAVKKLYYEAHKEQVIATTRSHRLANPKQKRNSDLIRTYGITLAQWDVMFAEQGSVCAICLTDTPGTKGWMTDHCHTAGHVRGILCSPCNLALGLLKDNPATLAAAITYLGK
jgi:hypothetical protein